MLRAIQRRVSEGLDVLPRLVMGPSAAGGVCVELHADQDNAIYVAVNNDATIEIDVQYRGFFFTSEAKGEMLGSEVIDNYEAIAE